MRSGPAERPCHLRGSVAALLAVVLLALVGCDREVDLDPPRPDDVGAPRDVQGAQRTLDHLVSALGRGARGEAVATAAESSRALLEAVADNAVQLRLDRLSARYVGDAALTATERERWGSDAWAATVALRFGLSGLDQRAARVETRVLLVPERGQVRIAGFGGEGADRTPLWLTGPTTVVRTPQTLVEVAGSTAERYPGLVTRAVTQVQRTLPAWDGPLVVEVPQDEAALEAAVSAPEGEYDAIAAVTTTVDGSTRPGAPVRVFVNPGVFGDLEPRGAQVVMSHEAAHVATGASFVSIPTWLLEGFADAVALRDTGVPVRTAAAQVLRRIRSEGLPDGLPSPEDLDPRASDLGATYEEAWLACRFMADAFGEPALVRFYDSVSRGAPVRRAFVDELGLTQAEFVARWRRDLADLAGVTPVAP